MDKLDYLIKLWQTREMNTKNHLISIKSADQSIRQVIDSLDELKINMARLALLGEQHDYREDLKYNGYRSFVKINSSAIERVEKMLNKQLLVDQPDISKLEKCLSFVRFINKLNKLILDTYEKNQTLTTKDINQNRKEYKLLYDEKLTNDLFETYFEMQGAFIYHSPECHEIYLQEFVNKIPNLYIMSVDYKLRQKYGRAHQDVLDAYLWLTSDSPDVVKLFGFKPKRFIIAGDSAGASLSFALCKMMKDFDNYVKIKNLNEKLIVPNNMISFYGFATLNKLSPSWLMTYIETIVTLQTLRTGFGSLMFGCEDPQFTRRVFFPFLADRKEQWYSSTNPKRIDYSRQFLEQFAKHPYLEPLDHINFEEFTDLNLYLGTCEFDVFLDANIELAQKWKGYVELSISDDANHGFLQFGLVDPISRKATNDSIELLKKAISKLIDST